MYIRVLNVYSDLYIPSLVLQGRRDKGLWKVEHIHCSEV